MGVMRSMGPWSMGPWHLGPSWTYGPMDPWTHGPYLAIVYTLFLSCFTCYFQRMQSTIGKPAQEFRDFAAEARDTVKEFYRLNHTHQTLDFVLAKKADYLARNRKRHGVWDALEFLDTLVDDSDPDVDFTQIDHALQTAEAVRRANQPRWLIVTGLIHDLGKILCLFGEPQWAVVGDTFPVGCQFSTACVYPGVLRAESRSAASDLLDAVRDLRAELRPRQRPPVVGTRRVHLPRRQGPPAVEALYALRYHSFYPWHKEGEYDSPRERSGSRDAEMGAARSTGTTCTRRAMAGPTPRRSVRTTRIWSTNSSPSRFSGRTLEVLKCWRAEVRLLQCRAADAALSHLSSGTLSGTARARFSAAGTPVRARGRAITPFQRGELALLARFRPHPYAPEGARCPSSNVARQRSAVCPAGPFRQLRARRRTSRPRLSAENPFPREGLPPGFRMRHDAHYVDQLTCRAARRRTCGCCRSAISTPRARLTRVRSSRW